MIGMDNYKSAVPIKIHKVGGVRGEVKNTPLYAQSWAYFNDKYLQVFHYMLLHIIFWHIIQLRIIIILFMNNHNAKSDTVISLKFRSSLGYSLYVVVTSKTPT